MALKELLALQEASSSAPLKGFVAMYSADGHEADGVWAFKSAQAADKFFAGLDEELEGSDMYATNDTIVDNVNLVMMFDHKQDSNEINVLGFDSSQAKLKKRIEKSIDDEMMYDTVDLDEIEYIATNG